MPWYANFTVQCIHKYNVQNMGQRYLELGHSYTGYSNNTATLHVRQLPRNPATFAPGPAFIFVVVNGRPSSDDWFWKAGQARDFCGCQST